MPLVGRFLGFMADRPLPADPYLVHKEPFTFYLVKLPIFWLPWTLLVPTLMGFLGCQVDSVLGATLEGGGLFTKEETNLLSITAGALLGLALAALLNL